MKSLKAVTRYVCNHCNQDFKTPTRHNCKKDPDKRNCLTCKHNEGWDLIEEEIGYSDYGYHSRKEWAVKCTKDLADFTAPDLQRMGWKLNCSGWESKVNDDE